MRLDVMRNRILIIPDRGDERDVAYIEEVLGLKDDGQQAVCRRVNVHKLTGLAYIEITSKGVK